jgi:hypothetical protein
MKRDYYEGTSSALFWGTGSFIWESNVMEQHLDYFRESKDHVLGQNLNAYYPRPLFDNKNRQCQTRYILNAAYIRLKNMQLGYTIPSQLTKKIKVSKLRLYVSGENLWTGTSLIKTLDPETLDGGYNGNVYPLSRVISVGLSLNF